MTGRGKLPWVRGRHRVADAEEMRSLLIDGKGGPYLPSGTGTLLERGSPPSEAVTVLDLSSLDRVVEHAREDLTITVEPGMRLADLTQRLREQNQWLPAAEWPVEAGTVGGLIGGDGRSPWTGGWGSVRDSLLGVTFLDGRGSRIRAGGRVVKNVAGFDFMKLVTGSLGELGAVVEATFRLLPYPPVWAGVALGEPTAEICARTLATGPAWLPAGLWRMSRQEREWLVVVFAGSAARVDAQVDLARTLWGGAAQRLDSETVRDWLSRGVGEDRPRPPVGWGGALPSFLALAPLSATLCEGDWLVDLLAGHLWWFPRGQSAVERVSALRERLREGEGHLNLDRVREEDVPVWGSDPGPQADLWRQIKATLDPESRWVRGRLPGGV